MFGVNKICENIYWYFFQFPLKIDSINITYQQVWYRQSDTTTAILEGHFGSTHTEFFHKKMEWGYTVILRYFKYILTKTVFDLQPKSTKKGESEN